MTADRSPTADIISLDFKKPFAVLWFLRLGFKIGIAAQILLVKSASEWNRDVESSFRFPANHLGSDPLKSKIVFKIDFILLAAVSYLT